MKNRYRKWTEVDDAKLLALSASGRSSFSMSAALARSRAAVFDRLNLLRDRQAQTEEINTWKVSGRE